MTVNRDVYGLAGDKIVLTHEDGKDVLTFGDKGIGRECGGCTLCCKLTPVPGPPLHKPAGVRCKHQRTGKGCAIYDERPFACRSWACRWLVDRETAGMPRPDRAHYVIDIKDDYIEIVHDDGHRDRLGVIQVWLDPAFPDARHEPHLRAYMLRMAELHRYATIVRFSSLAAITIFPPPLTHDGQWHERADGTIVNRDKSDVQVMEDLRRYEVGLTDE
jgi:hypothetical protein